MQPWIDKHPFLFGLADAFTLVIIVSVMLSFLGGWRTLSERFRFRGKFIGKRWRGQSAQLRCHVGYYNCLTVGGNTEGLYLSLFFPFRIAHPPLFIPWGEISFSKSNRFLVKIAKLELGREFRVPMRISQALAEKLRVEAGRSWPTEQLG